MSEVKPIYEGLAWDMPVTKVASDSQRIVVLRAEDYKKLIKKGVTGASPSGASEAGASPVWGISTASAKKETSEDEEMCPHRHFKHACPTCTLPSGANETGQKWEPGTVLVDEENPYGWRLEKEKSND